MELDERQAFLQRAKDICGRSAKARTEIDFKALANELAPESPDELLAVLVDPDRGLNDGFVPNPIVLGRLVSFRAKTSLWSLEFDRAALRYRSKSSKGPSGNWKNKNYLWRSMTPESKIGPRTRLR